MDYRKVDSSRFLGHLFSAPFIWLPLVALIFLDILAEIYQLICFPIYNIPYVKRENYILIMDRTKLQYLNPLEKLGCMYCGYANGLLAYLKEVAGRTEKYWCGIMHENKPGFVRQEHQIKQNFAQFNNEEEFNDKYPLV
jgi:hypothetical protein